MICPSRKVECDNGACIRHGCQGGISRLPTARHALRAVAFFLALAPAMALGQSSAPIVPDPTLTPGEFASTDLADICSRAGGSYSVRHRLSQTPEIKLEVLSRYGVAWEDRSRVEDDHRGPLCLGGSDSVRNRWPQPRFGIWNAALKDRLEAYACRKVCDGEVPLATAQSWFLAPMDWRLAYCAAFPADPNCPPQ